MEEIKRRVAVVESFLSKTCSMMKTCVIHMKEDSDDRVHGYTFAPVKRCGPTRPLDLTDKPVRSAPTTLNGKRMNKNKWFFVRFGLIVASAITYAIQGSVSAHAEPPIDMSALIIGLFFGIIGLQCILAIQFMNKKSAEIWEHPSWSENPFQIKQPIQFFHLGAWLFIASSIVSVIQTWLKSPKFILDALMPLVIGVGLLIGVHLSRLLFRRKFRNV